MKIKQPIIKKRDIRESNIKPERYNALSFYWMYQKFKITGRYNNWSESEIFKKATNIERYEYKALIALVEALKISTDLKSFDDRTFLYDRVEIDYQPVFERLKQLYQKNLPDMVQSREMRVRTGEIIFIYPKILGFLDQLQKFESTNSGFLEAGFMSVQYYLHITNQILSSINQEKVNELLEMVSLIICPEQLEFTKSELIEKYDFPDDDYEQLVAEDDHDFF